MQRCLISGAHETFCACPQSLHTPVRRQDLFTACSWPPPVDVFPKGICHFSLVSPKTTVLHNKHLQLSQRLCFSNEPHVADQRFMVEYAKRGMDKTQKGIVCIGKIVPNPFNESAEEMKEWCHTKCVFDQLERARATTKKMEDITDLEGWRTKSSP